MRSNATCCPFETDPEEKHQYLVCHRGLVRCEQLPITIQQRKDAGFTTCFRQLQLCNNSSRSRDVLALGIRTVTYENFLRFQTTDINKKTPIQRGMKAKGKYIKESSSGLYRRRNFILVHLCPTHKIPPQLT